MSEYLLMWPPTVRGCLKRHKLLENHPTVIHFIGVCLLQSCRRSKRLDANLTTTS